MNRETTIEIPEAEALDALRQVLREERKAYWNAQAKTKNGLKSDPFRQLERDGHLSAEFFLAEAARIMAKTSNLSAGQRAYISAVMDKAVQQALSKRAADKAEKARAATEKLADATKKATTATKKLAKAVSAIDKKPAASRTRKTTTAKKSPAKATKTAKE